MCLGLCKAFYTRLVKYIEADDKPALLLLRKRLYAISTCLDPSIAVGLCSEHILFLFF